MKDVTKIRLDRLSKMELKKREMNQLLGGAQACGCGCPGPSDTVSNYQSNWYGGYTSSGDGSAKMCAREGDDYSSANLN